MRDFPASERNGGFHLVAVLQKTESVVFLEAVVMFICIRPELHLFQFHDVLLLLGFVLPLLLLVGVLTVIDDFRDRRVGGGRNENQIKIEIARAPYGYWSGKDLYLAIRKNHSNLTSSNELVNIVAPASSAWNKSSGIDMNLLLSKIAWAGEASALPAQAAIN